MRQLVSILCGLVLVSPSLGAQEFSLPASAGPGEEFVDRVVAIVGDSAIFYSQIEEHLFRLEAAGAPIPQGADELRAFQREALDDLVNQTLVLNAASRDTTINVSDERIDSTLEAAWADQLQRFGSESAFRQALEESGQSVTQYRANMRDEIHRSILLQQYIQSRRVGERTAPISESEIREFYERERESIGNRPATLTFDQLVLMPEPSDSAKALAREEAERILDLLRQGEDFADLARRFSDDPGSGQQGGELGWIRRGTMVEEFETVAFRLNRGQTSAVVETVFGAHIVKVERVRGPERLVRHILVAAQIDDEDVARARVRASEIRDALLEGASISDFESEATQTEIPSPLTIAVDQLVQLPSGYAPVLQSAQPGDILGPVEFPAAPNRPGFAVIEMIEVREAGQFLYEDVRDQIRAIIEDERFEERLIQRLLAETYVEVRW